MAFRSPVLNGSTRLDQAATGGRSVGSGPPPDDPEAVKRIQNALVLLVGPMPRSFAGGVPDGVFGSETRGHVVTFQRSAFPTSPQEWDGQVGRKTLEKMDEALMARGSPTPPPVPFVCGPDVTAEVAATWQRVQTDFARLGDADKVKACDKILLPIQMPQDTRKLSLPTSVEELKRLVQQFADVNGWDTLPLYQGASWWLRHPPVFDAKLNGPCATPSSANPDADDFDPSHESDAICANTVQVAGKCWLAGTVNYGTFGIMVRLCSDFARSTLLQAHRRPIYSLEWAEMLIRAYKRFGANPEAAVLPIAWTRATYYGGPTASPSEPGNRPRCNCSCGCRGSVVKWDYVWEPVKSRTTALPPM